jgi:hypothetical protein
LRESDEIIGEKFSFRNHLKNEEEARISEKTNFPVGVNNPCPNNSELITYIKPKIVKREQDHTRESKGSKNIGGKS